MSEPDMHEDIAAIIRGADVRAPDALHERVAQMVAEATGARGRTLLGRRPRTGGRRLRPVRAWAALAAAAVLAVVVVAATGGFRGASGEPPVVTGAARLTLAASTAPAPAERPGGRRLAAQVEGVAFPYWEDSLGWRATGSRTATLAGRPTMTVYYADASGRRIGYAIVSGLPAPNVLGGNSVWRHGIRYRALRIDGAPAVVWLRDGRLCVISGRGVAGAMLIHLASSRRGPAAVLASPRVS